MKTGHISTILAPAQQPESSSGSRVLSAETTSLVTTTSAKEVMYYRAFVCLSVLAGYLRKLLTNCDDFMDRDMCGVRLERPH